jgi:hypothetical protein
MEHIRPLLAQHGVVIVHCSSGDRAAPDAERLVMYEVNLHIEYTFYGEPATASPDPPGARAPTWATRRR